MYQRRINTKYATLWLLREMNLFSKVIEGINVCLFVTFLIVIESICIYTLVFVCFNILAYTKRKYLQQKKIGDTLDNLKAMMTNSQVKDTPEQHADSDDEVQIEVRDTNVDDFQYTDHGKPPWSNWITRQDFARKRIKIIPVKHT